MEQQAQLDEIFSSSLCSGQLAVREKNVNIQERLQMIAELDQAYEKMLIEREELSGRFNEVS